MLTVFFFKYLVIYVFEIIKYVVIFFKTIKRQENQLLQHSIESYIQEIFSVSILSID